jgi:hypothetical protein
VVATASGALKLAPRKSVARLLFTAHAGPLWMHAGFGRLTRGERDRLLFVPDALRRDLAPLVTDAVGGTTSPRDRASALESWIRARCEYSLVRSPRDSAQPVVDFLTRTRSGHCEWFAAALATSLRVAGIPARVVSGFYASRWNELGSRFWVIRRRDAHAWVEAYLDDRWVRLDATPAAGREPDPYEGVLGFLARVRDAVSFEWSRRVLGFDREAQRRSFESLAATIAGAWQGTGRRAAPLLGVGAAATAVLVYALRRLRSRRRRPAARSSVAFYDRVLRALARRGLEKRPDETASDFARRAGMALPAPCEGALAAATRAFEGVRYAGGSSPDPARAAAWLAEVRGGVRARSRRGWTPGGA